MMRLISISIAVFGLAFGALAQDPGRDLIAAPPAFDLDGSRYVPVDFLAMELDLSLDAAAQAATGRARIRFYAAETGKPLLDLVPAAQAVRLNGELVAADLETVMDPARVTELRAVPAVVEAGTTHELEIEYTLGAQTVGYADGGVRLGFFMTDLSRRGYLERHAPSNLLFDRFPLTVRIALANATSEHKLFTNGDVARAGELRGGPAEWTVTFPQYFSAHSFYLHFTNLPLIEVEGRYQGAHAVIPFTIYAEERVLAERAVRIMYDVLAELERDYGHYQHERMLVYVTPGSGGMEYHGATMTSLGALQHEVFHCWFARSVTHVDGNGGWIDEALASWRDAGYPRPEALTPRAPSIMAGFPPYRRETAVAAYTQGRDLVADIDFLAQDQGGLRGLLRRLFQTRPRARLTTAEFQAFLEGASGINLRALFERYVFGFEGTAEERRLDLGESTHPRAYTEEELALYR